MTHFLSTEQDRRAGLAWIAYEGRARQFDMLTALLSRFNHDLRTPLNTVVTWTHLLQHGSVDSARVTHVADVLARNSREQTRLLDEFVDDARAVLGVLEVEQATLRLDALVAAAIEKALQAGALRGASFKPDLAADTEVRTDARRLERLVLRLLVGVSGRATGAAEIAVLVRAQDGGISLQVEAPSTEGDWSDAALLDLRLCSFMAAALGADLMVDGRPGRASVVLRLALPA